MPSSWSPSPNDPTEGEPSDVVRRFVEASRRAEIIALVNSARSDREVAGATVDELCEAMEAEIAFVLESRAERDEHAILGHMGLPPELAEAVGDDSVVRAALGRDRPFTASGTDLLGLGVRRIALCRWTAENQRRVVIGVARLYDEAFDAEELALLEAVTTSVGHALERTWMGAERDRHLARQAALARAASSLSASLVSRDVLETLSDEVEHALDADVVVVYVLDERGEATAVAGSGAPTGYPPAVAGDPVHVVVARDDRPFVHQPSDPGPVPALTAGTMSSAVAVPIHGRDRVEAVVLAGYHGDRWIEPEDVDLVVAFAQLTGVAWRNASDHAAAQQAASLDSLTGCLNHGAFQDRLREEIARAGRGRGAFSLALMDMNDFKGVNDTLGHLVGDALLRQVADALRRSVRPYDQVARYGGDEFALLLPSTDEESARRVVDRALAAVASVRLPERGSVSATAGLAHWRSGEEPNTVIARADRALLESKRARGRVPRRDGAAAPDPGRERQRLRRLATAGTLGTRLARLLDQRAIAETAIIELGAALGYQRCVLVRRGDAGEIIVVAAATEQPSGPSDASATEGTHGVDIGDGLRRALRERRTVLAADVRHDGEVCAELAVPVYVGGQLWGAMGVRSGGSSTFDDDDAQLVQNVADHLGAALRTAALYDQLDQTHLGTAEALAAALEAKDHYTADHARSIADLAVEVGRALGVDDDGLRDLRYGAIFHDIGKIAIPDAILNKPGPLTGEEFEIVRRHPAVGEQILAPVPFLAGVRRIVRHDHERWDGGGYPDGLRGEDIPLGARIVLVVDAYHAMRSDRPYRQAMPAGTARDELRSNAGTQFDPRVVDALLDVLEREPAMAERA
jgi:diguanylate cyclase (GGDEF)-like protein